MIIYQVLIEYTSSSLDRPFSYVYEKAPIKKLCRVIVPFNNKKIVGFVLDVIETDETKQEYKQRTGFELKEIVEVVDEEPLLNEELQNIALEVAHYYYAPLISVYFAMLPPSLKPKSSFKNKPKIAYINYVKAFDDADYDTLTTAQAEVLYRIKEAGMLKKSDLSPSIVNKLIAKKKIEIVEVELKRNIIDDSKKIEDMPLTDEQKDAYNLVLSTEKPVTLIEGVTGSGKTEVYIQLARKFIEQGKQVLMLVPEISLSYQMVYRFATRFDRIAILHSELTPAQRYDEYRKIKDGDVDIVIGARSAIFAPLDNIGLIIIDEEHSETYKQADQLPYYHALTVAKMRQKYGDMKIVLGSATPSIETKARALRNVYDYIKMSHRVNDLSLPSVKIVDMARRENINLDSMLISIPLRSAIADRLQKKEQTILLVNRRGYSPYVSCRKCGYVVKCPECQVALTYHYENNRLICHHCGYEANMVKECPKCQSDKIFKSGFGTEKIEQEINKLFPEAKTLRLDSDVTKKRTASKQIIEEFAQNKADILIGTQIVAKGHDFDNVTLVGVVLADIGLAIPSFRASERTFDLITQAIGRSGRKVSGEAYLQTYLPKHFVIETSAEQNYEKFFINEMKYRKLLQNPPYTYMTLLIVSANNEDDAVNSIYEIEKYLKAKQEQNNCFTIIGPSEMFLKKYNNKYRRKIVLKYKSFDLIRPYLDELRLFFLKKGSISLTIDVDPNEDY